MEVSIDKEILDDLISFKLKRIQGFIQEILDRWNETSSDVFIKKARNGTYPNAENDAIELRQQLLEEKKLLDLKNKQR